MWNTKGDNFKNSLFHVCAVNRGKSQTLKKINLYYSKNIVTFFFGILTTICIITVLIKIQWLNRLLCGYHGLKSL